AMLCQGSVGKRGGGVGVLGDMLEQGSTGAELHCALADAIETAGIDVVFCSGPLMHSLWEALPSRVRGGYAGTAAELEPGVMAAVRAGDALMVKGSLGSKMGPIVRALERQFPKLSAPNQASSLGWLFRGGPNVLL